MGASILIVEDNALARRNITVFLESAGYQVAQAASGEDALQLIEAGEQFDLIISDLRMPGMVTGIEVLSYQRRVSPNSRSILITAFGSDQIKNQIKEMGAYYMDKPIKLNTLLAEIERLFS